MRKRIFRKVDSVLPRLVARIPYDLALLVLRVVVGGGLSCRVWSRNSVRSGAFIFGVSDLDVTVLGKKDLSASFLRYCLVSFKRLFIFLGETNFYQEYHLPVIFSRMNPYELKRDPELETLAKEKVPEDDIQKFVFTLRMLFSDGLTLKMDPQLRQAKWKNHYTLMNVPVTPELITLDFVVNSLKEFIRNEERISHALDLWVKQFDLPGFDRFHADLGEGFGIMAPHCHLWFHLKDDTEFFKSMTTVEREVIKAQINWEFWGLYTQRHELDKNSVKVHFERLMKAYTCASTKSEGDKLRSDFSLLF